MTTATTATPVTVTRQEREQFLRDGYLIKKGLFSPAEVAAIRVHFDALGVAGRAVPGFWEPDLSAAVAKDPLKRYPRVMHPHRWDIFAKPYLLHPGVHEVLRVLFGTEPIACQSMFYFKPPGARGQALHQDNYYLQVKPGTCIAAWTAIDPATPDNGGLYVVPGTQDLQIVCPEQADEQESFVTHLVKPPPGKKAVPATLASGETLFFNGSLIHGSPPNRSKNQWRRSFICHYMPQTATYISKWYFPLLNFSGAEVQYQPSTDGGPCGAEFPVPSYGA